MVSGRIQNYWSRNYTFPAVTEANTEPALETVAVYRIRSENGRQQQIVEEGLESGDSPPLLAEKGSKGTR